MNIMTNNMTLAQLCDQLERKDLLVNKEYQRSDEVWPIFARSMLVETVLLGYPIPKITIRQKTDMKNLKTFHEIVDGQQRTRALHDFYKGEYSLASSVETTEFRGKSIHDLSDEEKSRFVTYPIGADVLVGASDDEVIEVFRRMNSYTAPLNPEEQRHASFQGKFKWFIYDMRKICETSFLALEVLSKKSFVRMQDAKLITELCHAIVYGITTTSKTTLAAIYLKFDKSFPLQEEMKEKLALALSYVDGLELTPGSVLSKPYNYYSLILAVVAAQSKAEKLVESLDQIDVEDLAKDVIVVANLSRLAEALGDPEGIGMEFEEFLKAASDKTNTKAQRQTRFQWFYRALTNQM